MQRNCLECKHCYIDYERDYSERTPGAGLEFYCEKRLWFIHAEGSERKHNDNEKHLVRRINKEAIRDCIFEKALNCGSFEKDGEESPQSPKSNGTSKWKCSECAEVYEEDQEQCMLCGSEDIYPQSPKSSDDWGEVKGACLPDGTVIRLEKEDDDER